MAQSDPTENDTAANGQYAVIVIGAGPAVETVADRVVRGGLTVAVVEADLAGGECSYWACMPTKVLLRPVELLAQTQRLAATSAAVTGPLDVSAALSRRDEATSQRDDTGQVDWLSSLPAALDRKSTRLNSNH